MRLGRDWLMPWALVCVLLWLGSYLVIYLRFLEQAEWFQIMGTARFALVFLVFWVTELAAAILLIGVGVLLPVEDDDGSAEKEKREECPAPG